MRRAWPGALAAALMLFGACSGDGRSGNAAASPPSGSSSDNAQSPIAVSNTDCDFKGITSGAREEGECTARGVAITVADKAHVLHGKEYDAQVKDVHTNGTTVTVTFTVTNTLDSAHDFDRQSDLVFLLVDGQYFSEQPSVETATDAFRARSSELQPGES